MEEMGLEIVPETTVETAVELAVRAEDNGFRNLWVTDHYNHHGVWPVLGAIAIRTNKILLGPGVTNPYTTNPCVIASSIATIDDMSEGRAVLGLGAGDKSTLESIGIPRQKPITAVEEAVRIIRSLLGGERVSVKGSVFSTRNARLNLGLDDSTCGIDIFVGAQGPQMLETASMLSDGILLNASHPRDVKAARSIVAETCRKTDRAMDSLTLACYSSFCLLDEDENIPLESKVVVAYIVAGSSRRVLERHDIDIAKKKTIKRSLHQGNYASAAKKVTRKMLDSFSVVGTSEECISRMKELSNVGIDQFVVGSPIGSNKLATIERIGNEIIPQLS
jgi:5,10-methylenetetrahydromethanopterin reductase